MPRHLISDVHEWIIEISTVPANFRVKPQPRERAWVVQRGKKTLLSLTLIWHCEIFLSGVAKVDMNMPMKYHYF